LFVRCTEVFLGSAKEQTAAMIKRNVKMYLQEQAIEDILPNLKYPAGGKDEPEGLAEFLVKQAYRALPLYGYTEDILRWETVDESLSTYAMILNQEANDEDFEEPPADEMLSPEILPDETKTEVQESVVETMAPSASGISYSLEQLADFDFLLSTFYTVDASTAVSSEVLNAKRFLEKNMTIDTGIDGPKILIYHTHSQEGFLDSVPEDLNTGIVGVGAYLAQILEETYGYEVLHVTDVFDMVNGKEDRNNAYTLAGARISELLSDNPSIQVVIDLHRDGVEEDTRLVTDINGKETARIMFFNGLSYSKKNGAISYLPNPYIEDNLALAFQLQLKAAEYFPGVTRKIYLKTYRYNMHLCPKTVLVECGAQTNTLEEAKNAMEPLASVLHMVLGRNE